MFLTACRYAKRFLIKAHPESIPVYPDPFSNYSDRRFYNVRSTPGYNNWNRNQKWIFLSPYNTSNPDRENMLSIKQFGEKGHVADETNFERK